jgi:hypothetical protein
MAQSATPHVESIVHAKGHRNGGPRSYDERTMCRTKMLCSPLAEQPRGADEAGAEENQGRGFGS